jgi:membrane-associated phospholipid phosphatase
MKISQDPNFSLISSLKYELQAWLSGWDELSIFEKLRPAALAGIYWLVLHFLGGLRGDHFLWGGMLLTLAYAGPKLKAFYRFAFPFLLTLIVYDSQRFYSDAIRGPIHVSEPHDFDLKFFGISSPQGILTPNEWCQLHLHPVLDLITGFSYLIFFSVFILISAYFVFYLSHKGTQKIPANLLAQKAARMPWAFFWLNILGYTTYYWYAAAPPWYVANYGLGPADLSAQASSAGCARFDQILGTHFFSEMYGRAADVFGAIPSLHIAYPLLAAFYAFQFGALRIFCFCFYLLMCFSAVYLNHHYVLDIIWGSVYALLVGGILYHFPSRKKQ